MSIYNLKAKTIGGKEISFEDYKGKTLVIVNTASKCGLTPQYKGLEELYKKYIDQGLVILGFPCNQFANQEPWTDEEIKANCLINYWVTFPVFKKIDVNWENTHEIFKYLKQNTFNLFWSKIKWNFTKFLINQEGKVIKRYAPLIKPEKIAKDIQKILS